MIERQYKGSFGSLTENKVSFNMENLFLKKESFIDKSKKEGDFLSVN